MEKSQIKMSNQSKNNTVELNIGDWVMVKKVGFNEAYRIESIVDKIYTVMQKEGSYIHKIKLKEKYIKKL